MFKKIKRHLAEREKRKNRALLGPYEALEIQKAEDLLKLNNKLGFGSLRLPTVEENPDYDKISKMVDAYIASGGMYFETAYMYVKSKAEDVIKKCLVERYPRDSFILCDKMPIRFKIVWKEGFEHVFNLQLKACGVDYFDVYLLHNVGENYYNRLEKKNVFAFLRKIKSEGKAKLIGISFHDKAAVLDRILTEHPEIDVVQLQINYQDWESNAIQSRLCYEVAEKHGKIVVVMEPLKGGLLVHRLPEEAKEVIASKNYTPASLGLKWVAELKNVAVVLSGMIKAEQVEENMNALKPPYKLDDEGHELIREVEDILKKNQQITCTNCEYCIDACPKDIPVNSIFELMNTETRDGKLRNPFAKMLYSRLVMGKSKASDCVQCGLCEDACSQLLPIREHLKSAVDIFETK